MSHAEKWHWSAGCLPVFCAGYGGDDCGCDDDGSGECVCPEWWSWQVVCCLRWVVVRMRVAAVESALLCPIAYWVLSWRWAARVTWFE